ncbi:hypothetical protein AKJ09_04249 [Labilithrix luteola]|uniref:Uncharacterized protein n=1 Tax=Labilithrix luteola TaxID=1391654 RepID=A0A0K1PVM7_9BACT|nr:hypothetical protein [Labilithrix luteola]AKU97585.1 hypothetical protein AKJ09_04249 [Labilithrix luteola]
MSDAQKRGLAFALALSPAVVVAGLALDARVRRESAKAEQPSVEAVARRLPTSDLALSGGARWLRAPSLEEPGAAFADGPAVPDPDPAGGAMAPPVAVWELEGHGAAVRVNRR